MLKPSFRKCLCVALTLCAFSLTAQGADKKFYFMGGATYGFTFHEPDALNVNKSTSSFFDSFTSIFFDNLGMTFGAYIPASNSLLVGVNWNGSYNTGLNFNSQNVFTTFSTLALSLILFPTDEVGKGFYIRGDVGRGSTSIFSGRTFLSSTNTKLRSFIGLGTAVELGFAVGEDRAWMLGLQGQLRKSSSGGTFSSLHFSGSYLI